MSSDQQLAGSRRHGLINHRRFLTPFSLWAADNLPRPTTGYMVGDIDKILFNYKTKRLMVVEEKCRKTEPKTWFSKIVREVIHPALQARCAELGIEYRGYHLIQFEKESPVDGGKIWLDRKEVDEYWLKQFLSMED